MERTQRFRYEMLVRVRDYGVAHKEVFPDVGAQGFARVTAAVAAVDQRMKDQMLATADAGRVNTATRAAVFASMKTIALAARRLPKRGVNPFKVPARRRLRVELVAARTFLQEAETRRDEFERVGLPSTFISEFRALVDELQRAVDLRANSQTARRLAAAGVSTALAEGFKAARDLDVPVTIATRSDPTRFAAWQRARSIGGRSSQRAPETETPKEPAAPMPTATELVVGR